MKKKIDKKFAYGYKVKANYLKIDPKNAYKRAKIEQFGFLPMLDNETEEWAEGWAKVIPLRKGTYVANWLKENIEQIYKKEKESENGTENEYLKTLIEEGHEFDSEGNLINEKYLEEPTQLCVNTWGGDDIKGVLFINMGIFYLSGASIVEEAAPEEIKVLLENKVIYKKRIDK